MLTPVHSNHTVQELQLRRKPKLQMSPLMKSCVQLDGRPQGVLTFSTISQSVPPLLLLQCFRLISDDAIAAMERCVNDIRA